MAIDLQTIEAFNLNKKNLLQLVQRIVHHVNASEEERAEMAFKKAGDLIGIDDFNAHNGQHWVNLAKIYVRNAAALIETTTQ